MTIEKRPSQPAAIKGFFRRAFETSVLVVAAVAFISFGALALLNGGVVFGLGFIIVGLTGFVGAVIYALRGARLGVRFHGDKLVVCHYFSERSISLVTVKRFYRSIDATVIESQQGDWVIEDSIFSTPDERDALLSSLETYMKSRLDS